jgi:hypothetical protein
MTDLQIRRGDYVEITFVARTVGSGLYDLSGATKIWFLAKTNVADVDASAVITKTLANGGITLTDAANGAGKIVLVATDTNAIADTAPALYYDLQILDLNGRTRTLESGRLFVNSDVTKAVS